MSDLLAPRARRRPISRVRSVTLVSIMFMIPMPPTSSDTPAMQVSSSWKEPMTASDCSMAAFIGHTEALPDPPLRASMADAASRASPSTSSPSRAKARTEV